MSRARGRMTLVYIFESEVVQLCPTLCDPMDGSPLGSSVHGILPWSGLPCPPPRDLSDPGIKPASLMSPALADGSLSLVSSGKPLLGISNL